MYAKLEMLIDGTWTQGTGKRREKVLNPANEQVLGELPVAERADLDAALAAADTAQAAWAATLPKERGRILRKAADLMRERADEIAVDEKNRIVSTPAYMLANGIDEVATGISLCVREVLRLVG